MDVKEKDEIVIVDKNETVKSNDHGYPFYRRGIAYGAGVGAAMGLISILIRMMSPESVGWDYLKYIVMAVAFGIMLKNYKSYLAKGQIFKDGLLLGALATGVASLVMAAISFFAIWMGLDSPYLTELREPNSLLNALALSSWTVLEGLTYGMLITFVWLLLLKDGKG